jgi:hypothetical protein
VDCRLVNGLPFYENDSSSLECTGIDAIRGMSKVLSLNQDLKTNENFFLSSQCPTMRRIDLI